MNRTFFSQNRTDEQISQHRIRSVREECLDKLLIINQAHLRRVMRECVEYFNTARPHQGIVQRISISLATLNAGGPIRGPNVSVASFTITTATPRRRKPGRLRGFLGYRHQYRRDDDDRTARFADNHQPLLARSMMNRLSERYFNRRE
jgi:hypothetical protein